MPILYPIFQILSLYTWVSSWWTALALDREGWLYLLAGVLAVSASAHFLAGAWLKVVRARVATLPRARELRHAKELWMWKCLYVCLVGFVVTVLLLSYECVFQQAVVFWPWRPLTLVVAGYLGAPDGS